MFTTATLNLFNLEDSEIKYQIYSYPDGQHNVKIEKLKYQLDSVLIKTRLTSWKDLEILVATTQSLKELKIRNIRLYISYFLGARSDRKFEEGSTNYIKNVIAPVINYQGYSSVSILDPHSDVLEACINNFEKISNVDFVNKAINHYYGVTFNKDYFKMVICSPDAGALKKIYDVTNYIGYKKDVLIAAKHRDPVSGKITHTEVPMKMEHVTKDIVIIDDICDGGRTFIEIAKVIKKYTNSYSEHFTGQVILIVTHGIFSAGLAELKSWVDAVYCTNSYSDILMEGETWEGKEVSENVPGFVQFRVI